MTETAQKSQGRSWLIAIAAFVMGILATVAWYTELSLSRHTELPVSDAATENVESFATATSTPTPSPLVLSIHDQPAGDTVTVNRVNANASHIWVAVHEMRGDTLGNVLGAVRVIGGADTATVPLLRPTMPGATYAAVLYRGDGDGEFDLHKDSIYVDFETGKRVVGIFRTY